jgi:hypothetical protein
MDPIAVLPPALIAAAFVVAAADPPVLNPAELPHAASTMQTNPANPAVPADLRNRDITVLLMDRGMNP